MTEQDLIARRVRDVISEVALDTPEYKIKPETRLQADLGMDGFDVSLLVGDLEEEFSIDRIDDAGYDSITAPNATAGDVLDVVMRHLKKEKV